MVRSYRVKFPFVDGVLLLIFFASEFKKDPVRGMPRILFVPKIQRDRYRLVQLLSYLNKYQNELARFLQTIQKRANAGHAPELR